MTEQRDRIEKLGASVIHHGKQSDRIYLMRFDAADMPDLPVRLIKRAERDQYSKIICKIPAPYEQEFAVYGFSKEAEIPGYYNGRDDCVFVSLFTKSSRKYPTEGKKIKEILDRALYRSKQEKVPPVLPDGFSAGILSEKHADEIAAVYREVFESYPFPITEAEYIRGTMRDNVIYFGIRHHDRPVALSSIEASYHAENGEMTDFATLPDYRGRGLAGHLLHAMDDHFREIGLKTAYTIARAVSPGMNLTFAGRGYRFGGTLINNTQIAGSLESMNIWYKKIGS
ncbi:MAG: putative beta-lysine N-acetyltransferase [Clostridiaceae bacterium]|nr:putative beta-lysine N-acetyltransferase [Clostridiaceae bacterium]